MSSERPTPADDATADQSTVESTSLRSTSRENLRTLTELTNIVGRKWHLVIVDRLLEEGPHGFSALKDEIHGVSGKVLSESLEDLEDREVVERTVVSERPFRVEYSLTEAGQSLEPMITSMRSWAQTHLDEVR